MSSNTETTLETRQPRRMIRMNGTGAEFLADLRAANFDGPMMEGFVDDLWLYGWDVLRGLVRTGAVAQVPIGIPHRPLTAGDRQTLHDSAEQREVLVLEALEWAIPKFVRLLKEDRWSPNKGRRSQRTLPGPVQPGFG